ncbi:MFS transporter [Alicyclobacillus vulcanalis]|uniref:Nitrate/nitrite transporter NarK n=2 Tax=Alicyclobacillus TaxID=29330 RepID=A0A1N7NY53_9BACL|nr:MFS transporter [Alicyclobacillus vulcanalis]SIT03263.1 Nitrate/nitrite transporter NarK [Alicyclobacillus vulcanalis]
MEARDLRHPSTFAHLDRSRWNTFHWKSVLTTGMGVLTDGYDLSSIGVVLPFILASFGQKSLTGWESSGLTGSALVGAALGALAFGPLANRGRKRFYGLDVLILSIAALAQAFVQNIPELIAVRFVLGFGVGADYVLSPVIMGENANARDRGKSLALGFGLTWGLGAALAGLVTLFLNAWGVPSDIVWRIVLALGALPSASVIYLRRKLPETPRYVARVQGDELAFERVVAHVVGEVGPHAHVPVQRDDTSARTYFRSHRKRIAAACVLWFLFDIVAYSSILFGPNLIAKSLGIPSGVFQVMMELAFTVPGALIGLALIDRLGRKPMQVIGFVGMGLSLILFSVMKSVDAAPWIGLLLYGAQNLMSQMGPGSVSASGMLGVELIPTKIRGTVQGWTVAAGRLGAAITAFVFPHLFARMGEGGAILMLGGLCGVAAVLTWILLPETKALSLEEAAEESVA